MSTARDVQLTPVQQDLKVASRALVRSYGGQVAAEELLGRAQSRYSDCGSTNTPTFLTIDEAAELEDRTSGSPGHPHVTRVMARRQGCELVPLPGALPVGGDLVPFLATLMKEFGDASSTACAVAADGRITRAEARKAEREFDDLIVAAVTIRAAYRAIPMGDGE